MRADPASARDARRFVAQILGDWRCHEDVVEKAVLLASELVTNAILHAREPIALAVSTRGSVVRIEVRDGTDSVPVRRAHPDNAMTGRGLTLVDALAAKWGAELDGDGKRVWVEVPS